MLIMRMTLFARLALPVAMLIATAVVTQAQAQTHGSRQAQNSIQAHGSRQAALLEQWKAGCVVSAGAVESYGVGRCFTSVPIPDAVFRRMQGKSYKKGCRVRRSSLRYVRVLHYNGQGQICMGELVCNEAISGDLVEIFRALYDARYPIERMVLVDNYGADDETSMRHNNTSCFNYRAVAGTKKLSNHSLGRAIDINPLYNPYVKRLADGTLKVSPKEGRQYSDRTKDHQYKIDTQDLCYREFVRHGFSWGGSWKSCQDYQHFEKEK